MLRAPAGSAGVSLVHRSPQWSCDGSRSRRGLVGTHTSPTLAGASGGGRARVDTTGLAGAPGDRCRFVWATPPEFSSRGSLWPIRASANAPVRIRGVRWTCVPIPLRKTTSVVTKSPRPGAYSHRGGRCLRPGRRLSALPPPGALGGGGLRRATTRDRRCDARHLRRAPPPRTDLSAGCRRSSSVGRWRRAERLPLPPAISGSSTENDRVIASASARAMSRRRGRASRCSAASTVGSLPTRRSPA